jgi:hypothetical protein
MKLGLIFPSAILNYLFVATKFSAEIVASMVDMVIVPVFASI